MGAFYFVQQPIEVLDYVIDFSDWLTANDFIAGVQVSSDSGLNAVVLAVSGASVIVRVSGGASNSRYKVSVTVTTDAGLVKQLDFFVRVKER